MTLRQHEHYTGHVAAADNSWVRRLSLLTPLLTVERMALAEAARPARRLPARAELGPELTPPDGMVVVLDGFLGRNNLLANGRRQLVAYLAPGECCEVDLRFQRRGDHSITGLTSATVAFLPRATIDDLAGEYPGIREAFRLNRLVEQAVTREWLVNLGQRDAHQRTASFLCELYMRLEATGHAARGECDLPFTQATLAESLGISAVHMNRVLQDLRRKAQIRLTGRRLVIQDLEALKSAALLDGDYLRRPAAKVF